MTTALFTEAYQILWVSVFVSDCVCVFVFVFVFVCGCVCAGVCVQGEVPHFFCRHFSYCIIES